MFFRSACCLGAVVAFSSFANAQSRPTAPTPTVPSNPTTSTPSTGRMPSTSTTTQGNAPDFGNRPVFLAGKVMLDDGTPPPGPVAIQRVCAVTPHTEAYTDSKGNFNFQLGQRLGVITDASEDTGLRGPGMGNSGSGSQNPFGGSRDPQQMLMGCTLRASLGGYRSESVNLSNHRALDNPDVGVIILHRIGNVEGLTISATSAMAPKDAKKAYEKALNAVKKDKWEDAQKDLEKATESYAKYAAAWYELGRAQEHLKNDEGAKKSYQQAIAADSKYVNPYNQLAGIAVRERNWQDVKDTTDRLLRLDPANFPEAWFYNAVANYNLKNFDAAEKSARTGLKVDTDHIRPQMNQLLAAVLAYRADYVGAAASLKTYLQLVPAGPDAETAKKQLALVEQKLQGSPSAAPAKEDKQ